MADQKPKHHNGKQSSYKEEYAEKLIEFFDREPYEDIELPHYDKDGTTVKWKDFKRMPNKLPTLTDFAKSIGVPWRTLYDWINESHPSYQESFSQAFTYAKELRKDFLIQNALQGMYPPLTFKFVAINMTDMRDSLPIDAGKGLIDLMKWLRDGDGETAEHSTD